MSSVNKVILVGRLGKDPENKMGGSVDISTFSIATSKKIKEQEKTAWHNLVAFGNLAKICNQYLKKGSLVYVEGELDYQTWESDGIKKYKTVININQMQMLGSKVDGQNNYTKPMPETNSMINDNKIVDNINVTNDSFVEDDLPF